MNVIEGLKVRLVPLCRNIAYSKHRLTKENGVEKCLWSPSGCSLYFEPELKKLLNCPLLSFCFGLFCCFPLKLLSNFRNWIEKLVFSSDNDDLKRIAAISVEFIQVVYKHTQTCIPWLLQHLHLPIICSGVSGFISFLVAFLINCFKECNL